MSVEILYITPPIDEVLTSELSILLARTFIAVMTYTAAAIASDSTVVFVFAVACLVNWLL